MNSLFQSIANTLDRGWRLLWTGLSFAVFGLGGLVLGLVVFPIVGLLVWNGARRQQIARSIISSLFRFFVFFMSLVVLEYRFEGLQPQRDLSRKVIVANHPSLIDTIFLMAFFPGADCVIKKTHWYNPFTMLAVRFARYIPNRDTEELIETAVRRLRQGSWLVLFPEGTRTTPGAVPHYKRGAAVIAVKAQADLLPVQITCVPTTLTKQEPWYAIPEHRVHYKLRVLPDIPASTFSSFGDSERRASLGLASELQARLTGGLNKP